MPELRPEARAAGPYVAQGIVATVPVRAGTDKPCTHVHGDGGPTCGATPTRDFLPGRRCEEHTPARVAGRPEASPDPARTLEGIRATHADLMPPPLTDEQRAVIKENRRRANTMRAQQARQAVAR